MLESLRQLRFPPEFRIGPPPSTSDLAPILERILRLMERQESANKGDLGLQGNELLAQLATDLWRLSLKMNASDEGATPGTRSALRPLQSAWDTLAGGGVEVQDHTGEPYDGGMAVEVLAFQPSGDLDRQQIIETVRPTVYRNGLMIQRGRVIVGQPAANNE